MSIRINNQTIAGNYEHKPTSYRYVGEIFQSAIPITDEKVACLDGHKIYSDEGYGSFIQHLISQSLLYPQLVCTEEVWQEKVTQYGSWGQFVINTQENSVRLPKIAGFVQGLNTLEDLAGLLEAGLPNIEGELNGGWLSANSTGAFDYTQNTKNINGNSGGSTIGDFKLTLNASLSNPIYGKSDTVQPQAIQYPYYIVLATGVVQEINVKKEVELNNPFFFGMYQYFETNPNNVSWLKSEGQWNNGGIYESFYEWLVNSYNDTESDVSVKSYNDTYTNFDYVLNQNDKTFRLPIEVKQKFYNDLTGDIPVAGNGMTLGLTNGTNNFALNTFNNQNVNAPIGAYALYGSSVGSAQTNAQNTVNTAIGVTTDPTKSGIEAQITQTEVEGLGLYFYVGDTVQNANIINVSKLRDEVKGIDDKYKSYITNCITEIPQRIKYDLSDGTLTIKAGSVIIVPYGVEDLTEQYTIGSTFINDNFKVYDTQFADGKFFVWVQLVNDITGSSPETISNNLMCYFALDYTEPMRLSYTTNMISGTAPNGNKTLYNTETNLIASPTGVWQVGSLPVMEVLPAVASIKQVFNGFGYIGSTNWVDKGVKFLAPNGRNEDGTLKNYECVVPKPTLTTRTDTWSGDVLLAYNSNINNLDWTYNYYTESEIKPTPTYSTWRWFNTKENRIYYTTDSGATWHLHSSPIAILGKKTLVSGVITSLSTNQPFRALDYNDKSKIISWLMPDYTSGVSISTGWKATYDCIGYCRGSNGDKNTRTVAIDGVEVYHSQTTTYPQTSSGWWIVPKGSTVTFSGSFNVSPIVYPFKGTN